MVLCHLLIQEDITFEVAHVNYQLRGDESDKDEYFIRKFCQKYFIPFHLKRVDGKPDQNLQNWAREIRYGFFNKIIFENELAAIVTAHHFDDQIETLILNFTRGSGISGIKGIASKRGAIRRPLLFARKSEILDYAHANDISWREDQTNAEDHYKRNLIRHAITPALDQIRENDLGMRRTFSQIKQLDRWLIKHFSDQLKAHLSDSGEYKIPLLDYQRDHNSFELFQLIKCMDFNMDQVEQILNSGQTGKQFHSSSHIAVIDRDHLIIRQKISVNFEPTTIDLFQEPFDLPIDKRTIYFKVAEGNHVEKSHTRAYFDLNFIQWPLQLRKWKDGDRFQPFGMYGKTKKISDLAAHLKLSFFEKEELLVMTDAQDVILWVVGYRRSMHAVVTEGTPSCLIVEVQT